VLGGDTTPPRPLVTSLTGPADGLITNQPVPAVHLDRSLRTDLAGRAGIYPAGIPDVRPISQNELFVGHRAHIRHRLVLAQSSYTWRVNVLDNALNYRPPTVRQSVHVIDTTLPGIISCTIPVYTPLHRAGLAVHDVDFYDPPVPDGAGLKKAQYTACSSPALVGQVIGWTPLPLTPGVTYYTDNWAVDFNALPANGTYYVSGQGGRPRGQHLAVYRRVPVVKTTAAAPVIINAQAGDYTWYGSSMAFRERVSRRR